MNNISVQTVVGWLREQSARFTRMADEIEATFPESCGQDPLLNEVIHAQQRNGALEPDEQLKRELRLALVSRARRINDLAKLVRRDVRQVSRALRDDRFTENRGWYSLAESEADDEEGGAT